MVTKLVMLHRFLLCAVTLKRKDGRTSNIESVLTWWQRKPCQRANNESGRPSL